MKVFLNSLACFLLGGALVFVMDRIPASQESGSHVDPPPPAQTRSDPKPPDFGEASRRIAIRREEIRKALNSEDWVKKCEFVGALQSADVPELLAVMLEEASPEGVDINRRQLLSAALANWAGRDIRGALDWAAAHPNKEVRRYLQQELLQMCARNDPFQAVDLALEIQRSDELFGLSDIAMRGMRKLCETAGNERKLAALMRKTAVPFKNLSGTSACAVEFAEGFDFRVVLDDMAATEREGLGIRASVLGLLGGWAKEDADAAHAWFAANGQVGSNDWGNIFLGVSSTRGQQGAADWFVGKYGSADESLRKRMTDGLTSSISGLAKLMNTGDLIARRMNQADAGCFVEAILKERLRTDYGEDNRFEGK